MPRGVRNDELWEAYKKTLGCGDKGLTFIVIFILLLGFILVILL